MSEVVIRLVSTVGIVTLVLSSVRIVLVQDEEVLEVEVSAAVELHVLLGQSDVLHRGKQVENGAPQASMPSAQTVGQGGLERLRVVLPPVLGPLVVATVERLHRGARGGDCVRVS